MRFTLFYCTGERIGTKSRERERDPRYVWLAGSIFLKDVRRTDWDFPRATNRRAPPRGGRISRRLPLFRGLTPPPESSRSLPVENYFESRKTTQSSRFVHTHFLTKIHSTCSIVSSFIVRLKGFPHVFAKIDENNGKIIKGGAENTLNYKKNLPKMLLLF
jgi:hypothetical protein